MATAKADKKPFQHRDRVILIAGRHGDGPSNPVWRGKMGKIVGTVRHVRGSAGDVCVSVLWDNEHNNTYSPYDLTIHENIPINIMFKGKTGVIVCSLKDHYIVNFKEDIKGFSCDGKYKKGSCLIVLKTEAEEIKK